MGMVVLHIWRRKQPPEGLASRLPHSWWFAALAGTLAGFTTMLANAAGPVMALYFLAVGLPKLKFVGTTAWFFLLLNALKVPFSVNLGLITTQSLSLDAVLIIPMIPGAVLGPVLLRRINEHNFETMLLALTAAATLRLLF